MKAAIVDGSKLQAEDIADKVNDVAAEGEEVVAEGKDVATEAKMWLLKAKTGLILRCLENWIRSSDSSSCSSNYAVQSFAADVWADVKCFCSCPSYSYNQMRASPMPLKNGLPTSKTICLCLRLIRVIPLTMMLVLYGRQQSYQPPTYMDRLSGSGINQNDFGYLEEEEMRQKADSIWREYMKDLQR
uniref:Uncharacterized protein n=1 Tax=Ditylenchus dipsaci TaxID=166011 RepID=A0A915EX14_9BILA